MEVIQGADALVYQEGNPEVITVTAPKPWPNHIIPTRQRRKVFVGPKGERRWMGDQGGLVWGVRNQQIEKDLVSFEERMEASPCKKEVPILTKIDQLVRELQARK